MKKYSGLFLLFLFTVSCAHAQLQHPVKWKFSTEQTKPGEATLIFKANIEKDWHIYSQFTPQDGPMGGPLPMYFEFEKNKCYSLIGTVTEPKPHIEFDSTFEVN